MAGASPFAQTCSLFLQLQLGAEAAVCGRTPPADAASICLTSRPRAARPSTWRRFSTDTEQRPQYSGLKHTPHANASADYSKQLGQISCSDFSHALLSTTSKDVNRVHEVHESKHPLKTERYYQNQVGHFFFKLSMYWQIHLLL